MSDDFQGSPAETESSTQDLPSEADVRPDAELLQRYVEFRDAAAFEQLVTRHQRMVMGVAFRILNSAQGAEDVFQETFFQLARLARSIRIPGSLAGWLHKVASNAALQMLLSNKRRASREANSITPHPLPPPGAETTQRLKAVLDQSLGALPEKYRMPIILCYLEGLTHEEAAVKLGCPKGSMSTLLIRGLELLRSKVVRKEGAVSGALLLSVLCAESQAAAPALISLLVRQASTSGAGLLLALGAKGTSLALLPTLKAVAAGALLVLAAGSGEFTEPRPAVAATRPPESVQVLTVSPAPLPIPPAASTPPKSHAPPEALPACSGPRENAAPPAAKGTPDLPPQLPDLPETASERARSALKAALGRAGDRTPNQASKDLPPAAQGSKPDRPSGWDRAQNASRAAQAAARATQERAQQAAGKGKSGK